MKHCRTCRCGLAKRTAAERRDRVSRLRAAIAEGRQGRSTAAWARQLAARLGMPYETVRNHLKGGETAEVRVEVLPMPQD